MEHNNALHPWLKIDNDAAPCTLEKNRQSEGTNSIFFLQFISQHPLGEDIIPIIQDFFQINLVGSK